MRKKTSTKFVETIEKYQIPAAYSKDVGQWLQ